MVIPSPAHSDEKSIHALLVLSRIPGIGPGRLIALVHHFRDPCAIASTSPRLLIAVDGIDRKLAETISTFFRSPAAEDARRFAVDQLRGAQRTRCRILTLWDPDYPSSLRRIYDPPPLLFLRGSFAEDDMRALAIVGTRTPTPYGSRLAAEFARTIAGLGITVVSGLARGIDTISHTEALEAGGRTIAIMGSGLDIIYPPENAMLAERITGNGAVVSEYLLGTKPDAGNFPRRNRIVSGLSLGTLLIETGPEGGAMITAATALDQNREVFAIPSAVHPGRPSGTNLLIKEGKAKLTESVEDILAELHPRLRGSTLPTAHAASGVPPLTLFEQRVFETLDDTPAHVDVLAVRSGLTVPDTLIHLLALEFKSLARQYPGKRFARG